MHTANLRLMYARFIYQPTQNVSAGLSGCCDTVPAAAGLLQPDRGRRRSCRSTHTNINSVNNIVSIMLVRLMGLASRPQLPPLDVKIAIT